MRQGVDKLNVPQLPRSLFDRSHEWKGTGTPGYLIPILTEEVLPGDSYEISHEAYIRMQPLIGVLHHRVRCFMHTFYVQNRTILTAVDSSERMNEWEQFIHGGEDGDSNAGIPWCYANNGNKDYFLKSSLPNYMGMQPLFNATTYTNNLKINTLPFRAYHKIIEDYYQDPNINDPEIDYTDTDQESNALDVLLAPKRRLSLKDYFTSATPWATRGTDSGIPLTIDYALPADLRISGGGNPNDGDIKSTSGDLESIIGQDIEVQNLNESGTYVDVRELRNALRVTEYLETLLKAGGRYSDQILAFWGVSIPDMNRRANYLGGGEVVVQIDEVLNTSDTANAEQANAAGRGLGYGRSNEVRFDVPDHGFIITLLSVMADNSYCQGVPRFMRRTDKFDYANPKFASIGDQEILKEELFLGTDLTAGEDATFGYQDRYAEYKEKSNWVCGDMYDTYDYLHLGRQFSSLPSLGNTFLNHNPRLSDAHPAGTNDELFLHIWNNVKALRPLPYFSQPGII